MHYTRHVLCLGALLTVAACKGEQKTADVLAQDSSLTRDLALANRDTTVQPQLRDVPATPPPAPVERRRVAERPAPRRTRREPPPQAETPPPPPAPVVTPSGNTMRAAAPGAARSEGRVGVIAAGTSLALAAGQQVCTNTNSVGDRFTATLSEPVAASNGVVLPAGATAVFEVTSLKRSQSSGDKMEIGVVIRSVTYEGKAYPVTGDVTYAQTEQVRAKDNNDAGKVLGGAAVGAVLGRIFSGRSKTKGTIIGAAGGAAAGAVLARTTAKYDACIPAGGRISVRLSQPVSVQASGSATSGNDGV